MTKIKTINKGRFFVYMLQCADNTLYTGYTPFPEKRLALHNSGKGAKYTRGRLPVKMVYLEGHGSKSEALMREAAIKKMIRKRKLLLIDEESNLIKKG